MPLSDAIEAVKRISRDLVVLPGSEEYDGITKSYFSELERELKPACFLTPSSVSQVADIVKAIKPFAGRSTVAICGSGQQATPGVANVHHGLTIHLRNLRGIEIDTEKKIVSVAAGERMGKVYETVMACRTWCSGLSYFSYARGFVCDNVVNYEIVLASGEIVNANAETNRDLWIALKGGGNNFGIVTRFDLSVFEQGQLWGGKIFLGYAAALGDIMCMNDIFCLNPGKPKALEPFADIQPQIDQMKTLRVDSLKSFTDEAFAGALANRVVKMSTSVKADTEILEYAVKTYHASFEKLKGVKNLLFSISFEPVPVSLIEQSISRGGNSLGLKTSDGPLVVVLFYTSWDSPSDDKIVYEVNKEALETIDSEAQRKKVSAAYRYLNYTLTHQDPISSYGSESKTHLQAVSAKYDPEGFFCHS
ncbi:hypothetical protein DL764_008653 [Monosporascus ibericus]|uniref:FAD-binding PCMH-type domain-containing protein n=1 Tax=Monosporascus ibericus TaxID=155417 RepID=A0A4V1X973_9PEZI|nr:hypothetical protein DL764_008653 [Monosporascus ibericus]